jgi:riboflavin synthase
MFTGIVESSGFIRDIIASGDNLSFWIESSLSPSLKVDQSLAHDGVCLTVEELRSGQHRVTAIRETLQKTRLRTWKTGDPVNLERAMVLGARLDGHMVQGHVDATGVCESVREANGSWEYRFSFPKQFAALVIEKGSICLNGISLTAFDVEANLFSVAIIPYTYTHTNISGIQPGSLVNLEFDMIGKYIQRARALDHTAPEQE